MRPLHHTRLIAAMFLGSLFFHAPVTVLAGDGSPGTTFRRIATFPVFLNTEVDSQTVSEIVAAGGDGNLLIYTDSETEHIGFVDITDPEAPQPDGVIPVGGEPTSVAVVGPYALAVVNTSLDFANPSGVLRVIDLNTRQIVRTLDLGGQPDSVDVSPDGRYAVVAIENERDEDVLDGRPPQTPAGFVVIVDLVGDPVLWTLRTVDLAGVPDLFPNDPEPEYVDINSRNIAAVTLQENNHIVLIDLALGAVIDDWSAGVESLTEVDTQEEDLITLDGTLTEIPREPDAVTWISNWALATADEGDLDGGSRGWTVFDHKGTVLQRAGNDLEHLLVRVGHYPESRSENKGNEPEGIAFARYNTGKFLFVGSERSSAVTVLKQADHTRFEPVQVLPGGVRPEGLLAIPHRNLFVTAGEEDAREDGIRSVITIYRLEPGRPTYPTIYSGNGPNGLPIPWAALSALAAHPALPHRLFTAYDSFFAQSRIFEVDVQDAPVKITREIILRDREGNTVNLDVEGLAARRFGGFWVVSEGKGSVDDPSRPVASPNLLLKVAHNGTILRQIELPAAVNALQRRFGLEGVASTGWGASEMVYVAFQREWVGDPDDRVRIGRYHPASDTWTFFYYPIDQPTSPNGGWVGLSEIVALGGGRFAVVERDNQAGTDARIKKIYEFSVSGLTPAPQGDVFPVVTKTDVRDLMPDLAADHGPILEKVEGMAVLRNGDAFIVTDNDGVDDSSGETQFIRLERVFKD